MGYNFPAAFPKEPNDGDTVEWSAALNRWIAVPFPSPGGTIDPLATTLFVDPDTTVVGTQDGSIAHPFNNLQAAVDAADDGWTILISPAGNAGATIATWADKSLSFIGMAVGGSSAPSVSTQAVIESLTVTGAIALLLDNVIVQNSITASEATCVVKNSVIAGLDCDSVSFQNTEINGTVAAVVSQSHINCSGYGEDTDLTGGPVSFDNISAKRAQTVGTGTIESAPLDLEPNVYYGDGSDGSLAAGFGTITLTRDTYYENVAFDPTDTIRPDGWRLFIAGTLDLRGAPAGAIDYIGIAGNAGSGQTEGAAQNTPLSPRSVNLNGATSGAGGKGGAVGGAGAVGATLNNANTASVGGLAGTGGKGGTAAGAGGAGGTFSHTPLIGLTRSPFDYQGRWRSGEGGSGGGGGGGGATGVGGGGGGGGWTGTGCYIAARVVIRDGTTNAEAIRYTAGAGGNGGNGTTDGAGGGGGGGSGGGGMYLFYDWLLGESTVLINNAGGAGGNGGTGAGGAADGAGAVGGDSGVILVGNLKTMDFSLTPGASGSIASGATGGAGGEISVAL